MWIFKLESEQISRERCRQEHNETPTRVSPSTYDEFRVPPHGNDGSVHCPEKLLHDDLDVPLRWPLQETHACKPTAKTVINMPALRLSRNPFTL